MRTPNDNSTSNYVLFNYGKNEIDYDVSPEKLKQTKGLPYLPISELTRLCLMKGDVLCASNAHEKDVVALYLASLCVKGRIPVTNAPGNIIPDIQPSPERIVDALYEVLRVESGLNKT